MAVIIRSKFQDKEEQQLYWTAEQFRICRQLAELSNLFHTSAKQDGQQELTPEQVDIAKAARQVSSYLDSIIA